MNLSRAVKIGLVGAIVVPGILMVYAVSVAVESARDSVRLGYVHQMRGAFGLSLAESSAFPARYSYDEGKQVRTHFYIRLDNINNQLDYDSSAAWDTPANLRCLQSPSSFSPDRFALLVAPNDLATVLVDDQDRRPDEITDGLADTLLVASVRNSDVLWTDPRDLEWEWFKEHSDAEDGDVGFLHQYLLFADLAIYEVIKPLPEADYRALWTFAGGEPVTRQALADAGYLSARSDARIADYLDQAK